MSHVDPPTDLLRRALEAEKHRPGPPASVRDHVLVSVVTSATLAAGLVGTAEAAATGAESAAEGVATAGAVAKGGWLSAKVVALVAASFAGGAATGASVHAVVSTPSAVVAPSAPAETTPAPSVSSPAPIVLEDSAAPSASAPVATVSPPAVVRPDASAPGASTDLDLSSERAIIERARTALMRGNAAAALETLALHERTFPRGRLSQEREVLTIHALVGVGRRAEAQSRADRFRQNHPDSPMLAAIDAVLPPSPPASSSR